MPQKSIIVIVLYIAIAILLVPNAIAIILSYTESDRIDTYVDYDLNTGIILMRIGIVLSSIIYVATQFFLFVDKYAGNKLLNTTNIISACITAFLFWFEIYYGSTFYYGEVRDKQGISFPIVASLLLTIVAYKKVDYKWFVIALINASLLILWEFVQVTWKIN